MTNEKKGAIISLKVKDSQSQNMSKFAEGMIELKISDGIEKFLKELLSDASGEIEIKRNDLAQYFGCVPSQINYVIQTRFTTERGYIVESRRGGGGYVRISRIEVSQNGYLMHVINSIGGTLDFPTAKAIGINIFENAHISERELELILAAVSDKALPFARPLCDNVRAVIFKNMLAKLI